MHYFLEIIPHAIWAVLGATVLYVTRKFRQWRRARGQGAIFAGLEANTLFVFPPRSEGASSFIPQMYIEDFLAINNLISAYIRSGLRPPEKIRDSESIGTHEKTNYNLILICSSKSNKVTAEAIELIRGRSEHLKALVPYFEEAPDTPANPGETPLQIKWNRATYPSPSYTQSGPGYEDIAMVVKIQSPWAAQHKILIVAGIRGIGTWGAGEFLKKWWEDLHQRKGQSRRLGTTKQGDFAAIVSVKYEEQDIKDVTLLGVVDLDDHVVDSFGHAHPLT